VNGLLKAAQSLVAACGRRLEETAGISSKTPRCVSGGGTAEQARSLPFLAA
jgi:hypothetical protein